MAGSSVSSLRMTPAGRRERVRGSRRVLPARVEEEQDALHARGVGQILDTSLDVLVSRFGACVGIAAACWVPYQVANELVLSSGLSAEARFAWLFSARIPEFLTTGFVCSFVGAYLLRRPLSAWEALRNGLAAAVGVSVIAVLQMITSGLFACLCFFPVVLAFWIFSVTPTVYVLERRELSRNVAGNLPWLGRWVVGLVLSIRRGARLVWGVPSFGRWLGWVVVAWLIVYWPLSGIPGLLRHPNVEYYLEGSLGLQGRPIELALVVISAVFVGISTAYFAICKTVYYVDERVRKEGFDLELRLERIAERAHSHSHPGRR